MLKDTQEERLIKQLLRFLWRVYLFIHVVIFGSSKGDCLPRVFYGGARGGSIGGPLVKVKRLQQYFPKNYWKYNIVYALSNAPYLSAMALDVLRLKGIPLVLNQNGVFYQGWYAGDWIRKNSIMGQAYHRANYVFWQSDFCRRAADLFLGKRCGAGEILYNAIDVNFFSPSLQRGGRAFTFLLTGKIGLHLGYRLESTIAGLAKARNLGLDARLNIAGRIEDINLLHFLLDKYSVRDFVNFLGSYKQENAPAIYQGADAYVMTKYLDPCPNTVIEALACGLPILYSDSGGVAELVGPDAGIGLSVPESWKTIHVPTADAIAIGMLEIAAARDRMSNFARDRAVRKFNIEYWVARHNDIFNNLLKNQR